MLGTEVKEKIVSKGIFQLLVPFTIHPASEQKVVSYLRENGFCRFRLPHLQDEPIYNGQNSISDIHLKTAFFPVTAKILFPSNDHEKGFRRYIKSMNLEGKVITKMLEIPFTFHSVDIILCPFDIGLFTIRTEIKTQNPPFSTAIEFGSCLRDFSAHHPTPKQPKLECEGKMFEDLDTFLFNLFVPEGIKNMINLIPGNKDRTFEQVHLGTQGIFVQSFLSFKKGETIDGIDVFRSGNLCGLNEDGNPFITANNPEYIERKLKDQSYDRFAPNTCYYLEEDCFTCLSNEGKNIVDQLLTRFFGEQYYLLLISLFHRSVLFKVLEDYSEIKIKQDSKQIRKLLYSLNSFSSNYFYPILPAGSSNKELFELFKKAFSITVLYNDSKEILFSLIKEDENTVTRKDSFLLLILTMYTVVCGIFSMNLFTDDLKGTIKWHNLLHYNLFEYFAVCIVFSGILATFILGVKHLFQSLKYRRDKKKWVRETILSSKKQ